MGAIKTDKNANGGLLLEITYGGMEAPFGGIDTSAPPAYIDPKCFAAASNFLVIDNVLTLMSWLPYSTPTLWGSTPNVILIGFGTFYNSTYKQLNYALGVIIDPFTTPASGVNYTFYITSWNPSNGAISYDDVLPITLYDAVTVPTAASLTLDVIQSNITSGPTTGVTASITSVSAGGVVTGLSIAGGGAGMQVGYQLELIDISNPSASGCVIQVSATSGGAVTAFFIVNGGTLYSVSDSVASKPAGLSIAINGTLYTTATYGGLNRQTAAAAVVANTSSDPNVTTSLNSDGYSVVFTAITPGSAGNSITLQDFSTSGIYGQPPPFYFSAVMIRNLEGGSDSITNILAPRSFTQVSTADIGGTLYFGNLGPMILQYAGPGTFTTNTLYQGVNVLRKFAGSLIGLGLISQLGTYTQNQDMIISWSAATELNEWAPISSTGNVTGAGFAQLADIGDALVGLIISNNTAFIIRQQGISYATALQNGTDPFDFAHISLGDRGEGSSTPLLVTQYDQMGAYVSNTNIFAISQGPSPIGEKIKNPIFTFLASLPDPIPANSIDTALYLMSSIGCGVFVFNTEGVYFAFLLGPNVYLFNASNGVWMQVSYLYPFSTDQYLTQGILGVFSNSSLQTPNQGFSQSQLVLGQGYTPITSGYRPPQFYALEEGWSLIGNITPGWGVTFPVEEISFGRFIVIDAILLAIYPVTVPAGSTVNIFFYINGVLFNNIVFTSDTAFNSGAPTNFQIYPLNSTFNAIDPQLSYECSFTGDPSGVKIQISKITMFGSFDPSQRPV